MEPQGKDQKLYGNTHRKYTEKADLQIESRLVTAWNWDTSILGVIKNFCVYLVKVTELYIQNG